MRKEEGSRSEQQNEEKRIATEREEVRREVLTHLIVFGVELFHFLQ